MPRIRATDDHHDIRRMIKAIFTAQGRDFRHCEQCGSYMPEGKEEIHHTKYEGATLKDLQIICHKCNTKTENKNLI